MSPPAQVLIALIASIGTLLGLIITQFQIARAAKNQANIDTRKVDAQAYESARAMDRESVDRLKADLKEARQEIVELRETLRRERREHISEVSELQRHIDKLEAALIRMIRQLRALGIDVEEEDFPYLDLRD